MSTYTGVANFEKTVQFLAHLEYYGVPKNQLGSAALANTTTASDCQTLSNQIPEVEPEQGMDGCAGTDFEKRRLLRLEWKTS